MVGEIIECAACQREFAKKRKNHYCCSKRCNRRVRGSGWRWLREAVLMRDSDSCQSCEATDCPLDAHHVEPLCYGGTNDLDNLTSLCKPCHREAHRAYEAQHRKEKAA